MPRFGKEKDFDKEDQLFQAMNCYGGAVFQERVPIIPREAVDFVLGQMYRFNVPNVMDMTSLAYLGVAIAITLVDYYDPYIMFWEYSDVVFSDDWCKYTYELLDYNGEVTEEADPCFLESYIFKPGQAEAVFEDWLSKPGLKQLPESIHIYINEAKEEYFKGGHYPATLYEIPDFPSPIELLFKIREICKDSNTGLVNEKWVDGYLDLALWAGVIWLFGPLSRTFRAVNSDLLNSCITEGEGVLYSGTVLTPNFYRKVPRVPESCYRCGVDAWCVETTLDGEGVFRLICEGCSTEGMPKVEGCSCGTKFCKYNECPHHEWFNQGTSGLRDMMRSSGQLAQRAKEAKASLEGTTGSVLLK